MSGVEKVQHIITEGIVKFQKGICVIVKNSRNEEKFIWFRSKSGSLINTDGEWDDMPKPRSPIHPVDDTLLSYNVSVNPKMVDEIYEYRDGLCVEIDDNNFIWFAQSHPRNENPVLRIRGFNKIYPDMDLDAMKEVCKEIEKEYGRRLSPLEDTKTGGGYRKRKSTKKRKNTRRKNTRRKNTRRKNTRRKKTRRKKTRRRR